MPILSYALFALWMHMRYDRYMAFDRACHGKDIYVVLGLTGVGKSTFIESLGAKDAYGNLPQTSNEGESCTSGAGYYATMFEDTPICMVDIPGFDDAAKGRMLSDGDILTQLFNHLPESKHVNGMIYLYDLLQLRIGGMRKAHMSYFADICDESDLHRVTLVTTSHRHNPREEELQLEQTQVDALRDVYWKHMIKRGSEILHFDESADSAWRIIAALATKPGHMRLFSRGILDLPDKLGAFKKFCERMGWT